MIDLSSLSDVTFTKTNIIILSDVAIILFTVFIIYKRMFKQRVSKPEIQNNKISNIVVTSKDIRAIAGDDVMVTQLDLARAYIELGKKKMAKQILDHVIKHGNPGQQLSARQLMAGI